MYSIILTQNTFVATFGIMGAIENYTIDLIGGMMKQVLLCFAAILVSSVSFATTLSQSSHSFAHSLGNAFKNHAVMSRHANYQAVATIYGGEDVANKPFPALRAIA